MVSERRSLRLISRKEAKEQSRQDEKLPLRHPGSFATFAWNIQEIIDRH